MRKAIVSLSGFYSAVADEGRSGSRPMRTPTTIVAALIMVCVSQAALALEAKNTMADWARASEKQRSTLIDALRAKARISEKASRMAVLDCMNRAAKAQGHAAIRIDEMAKVCAQPSLLDAMPDQTEI